MSDATPDTARVLEVINELLDPDTPVEPDTRIGDLDLNSMQITDLIMALEDEFSVRIRGEDLGAETRLADVLTHTF